MSYMESKMQDQIDGSIHLQNAICDDACEIFKETGTMPLHMKMQRDELENKLSIAHGKIDALEKKLILESGFLANETLRADQMSKQHSMQCAMSREFEKDAARYRWVKKQAEFFPLVMDGAGILCAEYSEAEEAIDSEIVANIGE